MRVISTLALTNSAARPLGGNLCENLRCDHCHTLTYDLCGSNKATIRTLVDGEASAREGSGNGLMEGNCCAVQGDLAEMGVQNDDGAVPAWSLLVTTHSEDLEDDKRFSLLDLDALELVKVVDVHLRRKFECLGTCCCLNGWSVTDFGLARLALREHSVGQGHLSGRGLYEWERME